MFTLLLFITIYKAFHVQRERKTQETLKKKHELFFGSIFIFFALKVFECNDIDSYSRRRYRRMYVVCCMFNVRFYSIENFNLRRRTNDCESKVKHQMKWMNEYWLYFIMLVSYGYGYEKGSESHKTHTRTICIETVNGKWESFFYTPQKLTTQTPHKIQTQIEYSLQNQP